jgi:Ca2+-binding RTX toxin-like protein
MGHAGVNVLRGMAANDVLNGLGGNDNLQGGDGSDILNGGTGVDTMIGGNGSDAYYVDSASDVVVEGASQGTTDWVRTTVTYTLAAGVHVENLATTDNNGTDDINLTGNETVNFVWGNDGNNWLNGGGEADTMIGGEGDDRYYADRSADQVEEFVGSGTDELIATTSYVLGFGDSVETLRTMGSATNYLVNLVGNELDNNVYGNAANNLLLGKLGNDTMIGAGGNDAFIFDTALGAGNIDTIVDYNVAQDTIQLQDFAFAGLALGTLAAGAFRIGAAALDADDRIIYDNTTGAIFFDSNGNAAGGANQFATLSTGLALTNNDIVVI